MTNAAPRIAFADALRGPAALLVLASHHLSLYWHYQPFASAMAGQPAAFTVPPAWTQPLATLVDGPIRAGAFGVALFFLVSGYVIPLALADRGTGTFLAARAIRLLPTYWAGLALQLAVVASLATDFPRTAEEMALSLLPGLQALGGRTGFDGIVWTLNVEAFFYLAAAAVAPALRRGSPGWLAMPAGAALIAAALSGRGWPVWVTNLSLAATMIVLISVGTALHLTAHDPRWRRAAPVLVPALVGAYALLALSWPVPGLGPEIPSHLLAVAIFVAGHVLRDRISVPRPFAALSAISYPLYVVHGVSGFAIIGAALRAGLPSPLALTLALAWSFAAAILLHAAIERPTRRAASRWGRRGRAGEGRRRPPDRDPPGSDGAPDPRSV